jgi:hypothetical protein
MDYYYRCRLQHTVLGRADNGVTGSKPALGMYICTFTYALCDLTHRLKSPLAFLFKDSENLSGRIFTCKSTYRFRKIYSGDKYEIVETFLF